MEAHILPLDKLSAPGVGSNPGVKRSKHFFLKVVMLHIKLKGMKHNEGNEAYMYMHTSKLFALIHTLHPLGGVKR